MSGDSPYPRRRLGPVLVVLAAAFLAGLALMAALVARFGWFAPAPPRAALMPVKVLAAAQPARATAAPPVDAAVLQTREAILSAQLASVESRTAIVSADADEAGARANRAEAMLLAFAARRAVDRGLALGGVEAPLVARFAATQPQAVDQVRRAARERLTLEDLRAGLDALGTGLVSGGDGWWSSMRHSLRALVVVHPAGTPSTVPAERLARARRLLDTGQVEAAIAEVEHLPGATEATNWLAAARRYVDAHRALDTLETAALAGQGASTAPAR